MNLMTFIAIVIAGCACFVFGFVMGVVCASATSDGEPVEPCQTLEDIIKREG